MFFWYKLFISIFIFFYQIIGFLFNRQTNQLKYQNRLGRFPQIELSLNFKKKKVRVKTYWIHAVSAGEVKLACELIKKHLKDKFIFISYMSNSAQMMAETLFKKSDPVVHFFLPFDKKKSMISLIDIIRPEIFLVIEHDTWPQLLFELGKRKISRIMLNYHLKPRDYFFYRLFPPLFRFTHRFDVFLVQDQLVLKKVKTITPLLPFKCIGNLKYDFNFSFKKKVLKIKKKIVLLASSHYKEEIIISQILLPLLNQKKIILIIVPRHIERIKEIQQSLENQFKGTVNITVFNSVKQITNKRQIMLLNRYNYLSNLYSLTSISLIGDSFIKSAVGHNIIESIYFKKPTFYGEYMINFQEITEKLEEFFPNFRLKEKKIYPVINNLLNDPKLRRRLGKKSFEVLNKFKYNKKKLDLILKN